MNSRIQFITNIDGERTAVILPVGEYENLLDRLDLLSAAYQSRNDTSRPLDEVIDEMRAAGEIDV
ncbi:MAG TPA: hypothetical protein DC054_02400 [Blastocatellia bacterium]|nr:hypothetical protein [Blastocatellia bacterium]